MKTQRLDGILDRLVADDDGGAPLLVAIAALRGSGPDDAGPGDDLPPAVDADPTAHDDARDDDLPYADLIGAVLAWAAPYRDVSEFCAAVRSARSRLAGLRRDNARLTLATAHATKGLEFDDVAVIDMDAGRFPSQRTLDDADDPIRALEEERRLAYVAWTRARGSLTLVYDPAAPSRFLREAFSAEELGAAPGR